MFSRMQPWWSLHSRSYPPVVLNALDDAAESKLKEDHTKAVGEKDSEIARLKSELEKKAGGKKDEEVDDDESGGNKKDDDDLRGKAKKAKVTEEEKKAESRRLESAIRFNIGMASFVESNKDILPSSLTEIIKIAEKERYDSDHERASALKSALVQEFFSVQSNVDLLTASQKVNLADYLKLTKTGKQDKADGLYENLFEPTVEMIKRLKKAEEVGKANRGLAGPDKVHDNYKQRLIDSSKKHHLNEKGA